MALGELNQELTGLINRHGGRAVGLDGQDGRFIHARRMSLPAERGGEPAPELGFVGDVESIDTDLVELLLSRKFIPVIMPIGVGADGTAYHINSDLLAGRLARALAGREADPDDQRAPAFSIATASSLYILKAQRRRSRCSNDGTVAGGMRPRLAAALQAVREDVRSVHIIDGGVPSALLLEVLTAQGVGTAVRSDIGPNFLEDSRGFLLADG